MIDIWGIGPEIDKMELLIGSMGELLRYVLHFILVYAAAYLIRRFVPERGRTAASVLLALVPAAFVWMTGRKSEFAFSFLWAALLAAEARTLGVVSLENVETAFLFSAMMFPGKLFNYTSALLGNLWMFWLVSASVYAGVRLGAGRVRGNHFACYFLSLFLSLSAYLYNLACAVLPRFFGETNQGYTLAFVGTAAAAAGVLELICLGIRGRFGEPLKRLNQLGKRYGEIERYFPVLSFLILAAVTVIFLPFTFLGQQNGLIMLLIPCLCLVLLGCQLPFVGLFYRAAFLKDAAAFHRREKDEIVSYYQSLSGNLDEMQKMRHDMKNIFFTMGNYVERSSDQEMKAFFWEKIYPYAERTLRQNELLSRLCRIPEETLRAFLHLKLSQAVAMNVAVELEVQVDLQRFFLGLDIIDLTRVLGILLDNAMEEAAQVPGGVLSLRIAEDGEGCSYIIKNPVTGETRARGIHPGISSKGEGRGQGLKIVREILEQYAGAALNSSLQGEVYVQSLNIKGPGGR